MATLGANLARIIGINVSGDVAGYTFYRTARGRRVFYPAAPPRVPASRRQIAQRNRWRAAAMAWRHLPEPTKEQYRLACQRGHLRCTAPGLWIAANTTHDPTWLTTIERNTNTTLA